MISANLNLMLTLIIMIIALAMMIYDYNNSKSYVRDPIAITQKQTHKRPDDMAITTPYCADSQGSCEAQDAKK